MHHRSFAVVVVVLFAGAALAGCTQSTTDPEEKELGAAFVKRSCEEVTPESRAGASLGADVTHALAADGGADVAVDQEAAELVVATFMPMTGDLSAFGPDGERAAKLAAKQINQPTSPVQVRLLHGDTRTDPTTAPQGAQSLIAEGADVIVGAYASSTTDAILPTAVDSKTVVITPASTSPALTLERNNQGYFFRVPPSDALQGKVLADLVWSDGCQNVNVIAVNNPYGKGLGQVFREAFTAKGGTVGEFVTFDPKGSVFTSEVQQVARNDPDAVVYVGYPDTGGQIVKTAFQQGKMKKSVWFFSEGVKDPAFVTNVGKAQNQETNREEFILAGLRGTAPEAASSPAADAFRQAWAQEYPDDADGPGLFAAEAYDAVMIAALAAAKSLKDHPGEVTGEHLKDEVRAVANAAPGDTPVTGATIQTGLTLAATGGNVDYQGVSGDFDFDENGDPASGIYSWWKVNDDGTITTTKSNVKPGEPPQ